MSSFEKVTVNPNTIVSYYSPPPSLETQFLPKLCSQTQRLRENIYFSWISRLKFNI